MTELVERDLDEWVAGDALAGTDDELPPPADADQADRYLWALRRLDRDEAAVLEVVEARAAQLRAYADDRVGGLRRRREHLERLLEGWARAQHRENPKRLSWKLPGGTLKLTAAKGRTDVTDEAALLDWLEANAPELVKVTRTPRLGELAKAAEAIAASATRLEVDGAAVDAFELVHGAIGERVPGVRRVVEVERRFAAQPARPELPADPEPEPPAAVPPDEPPW